MTKLLQRMAREFAVTFRRERKTKVLRKKLAEKLLPAMMGARLVEIPVGTESVFLSSDTSKAVTKGDLVKFFGAKVAESFWSKLPEHASTYLTLKPTKKVRKVA